MCVRVEAAQVGDTGDRLRFGNLFHPTTIRHQMAGRDTDPVEILQRGLITRQDLDRSDLGTVLQDVADTDLAHETDFTAPQGDILL